MSAFAKSFASWLDEEVMFRISHGRMSPGMKGNPFRARMRSPGGGRRGGQLWRVAQGSDAAFVKRIKHGGCYHPKQLAGQMAYINGKAQEIFGNAFDHERGQMVLEEEGVSDLIERWSEGWKSERINTKNGYTTHMVLSFASHVTDRQAVDIAREWCREMFQSREHGNDTWQYYAALHTDTANPHVHVVINNRGVNNGQWFYVAPGHDYSWEMMRDALVDIGDEHGVFLDSASRLEKGKLTYELPSHLMHKARRLGQEVIERPVPESVLAASLEVMRRHAVGAELMAGLAGVMTMQDARDALASAAVDLREGRPVTVTDILREEELVQLDLTQHPADIRQAIVQWTGDNAERIAQAEPVVRDRFVKSMFETLDKLDSYIAPDATDDLSHMTGQPVEDVFYSGTFMEAAIGDKERLMQVAEDYLETDEEIRHMRHLVESGEFGKFLASAEYDPSDEAMLNAVGSAFNEVNKGDLGDAAKALDRIHRRAEAVGLDADRFEQRILNGAYDARMEYEWMAEDVHTIMTKQGLDFGSEEDRAKATNIVTNIYDFVADQIDELQSNHIAIEPVERSVSREVYVARDHSEFVERSAATVNMMRVYKTAVFETRDDEVAFLEDFKHEFGEEGIKQLAKGDLDVIKDLAIKEQDRRDIAYALLKLYKRNPELGIDAQDISDGMDLYNPSIWHGQGGHSI